PSRSVDLHGADRAFGPRGDGEHRFRRRRATHLVRLKVAVLARAGRLPVDLRLRLPSGVAASCGPAPNAGTETAHAAHAAANRSRERSSRACRLWSGQGATPGRTQRRSNIMRLFTASAIAAVVALSALSPALAAEVECTQPEASWRPIKDLE